MLSTPGTICAGTPAVGAASTCTALLLRFHRTAGKRRRVRATLVWGAMWMRQATAHQQGERQRPVPEFARGSAGAGFSAVASSGRRCRC